MVSPSPRPAAPVTCIYRVRPCVEIGGERQKGTGGRLFRQEEEEEEEEGKVESERTPPTVFATPPTVLPTVDVTNLAAPVTP